ncbi:MAG: acyltransferase [Sphingomonas sp.]|nr:acyltransferase [Sphingomonas sp.]
MRDERAFDADSAEVPSTPVEPARSSKRIPILDGWRATSILLVLGAHLLPLGPNFLGLNETAGAMGMALFFTLSGFLIVQFLAAGTPLEIFVLKRLARIVPLSWAAILFLLLLHQYDALTIARNLLFTENLPPMSLLEGGEHLWSLCVEMQFYLTVATICLLLGRRGLYLIPVLAVAVTCARIYAGQYISIVTWHRVDEIFAGGTIALAYSGWLGERASGVLRRSPVWPFAILLIVCSHPQAGAMQYLRPYAAAALVGVSLTGAPALLQRILVSRPMAYVADISYALYVIHGVLSHTWLGSGERFEKYLKRPLLIGLTFALAHLSTRYYEQPITRRVREFGKRREAARRAMSLAGPAEPSRPSG